MTTIEKMAKATYVKWIEDVQDLEPPWDDLPESHRDRLIGATRAALQAIREPDTKMLRAMDAESYPDSGSYTRWQAAITAILEEKPE